MRRLWALVKKESYQVARDPAALVIAFVLPPVLLFLYAYAISLDVENVSVGIVLEEDSPAAASLAAAFNATRFLSVTPARGRHEVEDKLVSGELKAFAVIPDDFEARLLDTKGGAAIQIITDASNPNTANFTAGYLQGVYSNWLAQRNTGAAPSEQVALEQRFWFNPELKSRRVLVPGSIAVIMTIIGTLLTAMVVSREWERGTMEALMATPATMGEIIISKLIPYFALGLIAVMGCAFLAIQLFDVPLQGSLGALVLISCVFLVPALGQGLLISTVARSQFLASQMALMTGFLPSLLLSGFLFETQSMPWLVQQLTRIIPARYYVSSLQTVFLAGDIWSQLLRDMAGMLAVGIVFFAITRARSGKRLD